MTQYYYCYKAPAPQAVIDRYPHAAEYVDGQAVVVGESFPEHASRLSDIAIMGLQEDDGLEEGVLKESELLQMVNDFLQVDEPGVEIKLSRAQGLYLYSVFKPVVEEEVI
jgi:hypothetical protein